MHRWNYVFLADVFFNVTFTPKLPITQPISYVLFFHLLFTFFLSLLSNITLYVSTLPRKIRFTHTITYNNVFSGDYPHRQPTSHSTLTTNQLSAFRTFISRLTTMASFNATHGLELIDQRSFAKPDRFKLHPFIFVLLRRGRRPRLVRTTLWTCFVFFVHLRHRPKTKPPRTSLSQASVSPPQIVASVSDHRTISVSNLWIFSSWSQYFQLYK